VRSDQLGVKLGVTIHPIHSYFSNTANPLNRTTTPAMTVLRAKQTRLAQGQYLAEMARKNECLVFLHTNFALISQQILH